MTPTLPEILRGNFACLATPAPPEAAGDHLAANVSVIALLNLLGAQEAEQGAAAVLAENAAIEQVLAEDAADYDASALTNDQGSPDARNAELRRALIRLHETAEARGDRALDRRILRLYRVMAEGRRLVLPPMPAG